MPASRLKRSDLYLPALLGLVGGVEILAAAYKPLWLALASYLLAASTLAGWRAFPLLVPVVVAGIYALTPVLGFDVSEPASWVLLIAVACFATGLQASRSRRAMGLAAVLLALAVVYTTLEWLTDFEPSVLFGLIVTAGAWVLGRVLREALDRQRHAGAEAERALVDRAHAAARATESERERIAAELHDVLAHALSAMVVLSSVARDRIPTRPDAARAALHDVVRAGREALTETGRLLRLLRDEHGELGLRGKTSPAPARDVAVHELSTARPRRIPLADAMLPVGLAVAATLEVATEGYGGLDTLVAAAACWLAAGALYARHVWPVAMPVAVTAILLAPRLVGVDLAVPIVLQGFACYSAGRHSRRAIWSLTSVLASIALLALDSVVRDDVTADAVFVLGFLGLWAVGLALRETLRKTRELGAATERARLERELEAERAAAAERKRIARELHDVLANSLSVMIVQASVAADVVEDDPPAASAATAEVQRAGREALDEIGRLLRLIRDGGDDAIDARPQRGVADVPALAEEYVRAGLEVDIEMDGVSSLPMGVELSAYRVVQEGLTNALKHAPGSPVHVRLAQGERDVAIEVRNGPSIEAGPAVALPSGYGLTGLVERVTLFGGHLEARPTDDGGFVLAATMPLASEAR